jgi:two-component system, LuxR family, response regulator FixJ
VTRTVYIIDDNVEFLQSAQWWLEGAGFHVKSFSVAKEALQALSEPRPNACVLLDVRMPDMSGLEVHEAMLAMGLDLPVVYMTGHGDVPLAVEAMRKGAVTFIEKPFADEALESALELAFKPRPKSAPAAPEPPQLTYEQAEFARRMELLTRREREVVDLVVQGKLNKTIADILGISIKTVELHRKNCMMKLGATSGVDLTRRVVTNQVINR